MPSSLERLLLSAWPGFFGIDFLLLARSVGRLYRGAGERQRFVGGIYSVADVEVDRRCRVRQVEVQLQRERIGEE